MKTLLIIAGSDSGGGAGIQADIKTASAHNVFATTAITALTAQNTLGVSGVVETPSDFVAQQIRDVLSDIGANAVKIGMLSSAAIIEAVHSALFPVPEFLVLDTVMLAKGGAALLKPDAVEALKTLLIPIATIVTPNIPEAEILSGITIKNTDDMLAAAHKILGLGAKAVLVKGGHLPSETVIDILLTQDGHKFISHNRIKTKNTHGTGCTLATAIACNLANGQGLTEAVQNAADYVHNAILTAPKIGSGHGPLNHMLNHLTRAD
jgi:hydroxymethylpyrimidine/phosphomethylpyrimidine kinase